jgi:hypothetical protein
MPSNRDTLLQIGVICFLIAIIGVRLVSQYPVWFNGAGRNIDGARGSDRFITLASATSTEDSGFLNYILPIFRSATGLKCSRAGGRYWSSARDRSAWWR